MKHAENINKEAMDGEVNLEEEDPAMVERLVDYFYTLNYRDTDDAAHTSTSQPTERQAGSLMVNARMYEFGDKYDIPPLKDLAKSRFKADLKINWNSENIHEVVDVVYNTTPEADRSLRDCMKKMVQEHGRELFEKEDFKEAVKSIGGFALDVVTVAYCCDQPLVRCSYSGCSKKDDSALRLCQYHLQSVQYLRVVETPNDSNDLLTS